MRDWILVGLVFTSLESINCIDEIAAANLNQPLAVAGM